MGQASCLPASPKQARCLLHSPPFLLGNTLKIQPPLSPNQTSRTFQEVLSDPAVGDLKRRVGGTQSAPAKAKGWREKLSHPLQVAKIYSGSSLFSVGAFLLNPEGAGSHPQMPQISADVFMGSTPLLDLRNLRLVTQSG